MQNKRHPIIVLGLYFPGIDILKQFKKEGFHCIGMDSDNAPGLRLRNIPTYRCPNPMENESEWLNYLLKFKQINPLEEKPVILNTSDVFLPALLKNQYLKEYFLFHNSHEGIVQKLMNKAELIRIAVKNGLPVANTYFFQPGDDVKKNIEHFKFPLLVRPQFGKKWQTEPLKSITNGEKLVKVSTFHELSNTLEAITPHDTNLIIQEIIEGPDSNLLYLVCYLDRFSKCKAYFCGQKLRLIPAHFGSASYMKTHDPTEILPYALKLLENNKYHGPAGVEFKRDDRDGQFKIVEINTRFGLWDIMGGKLGVNMFKMAYDDLTGKDITPAQPQNKELYWWSISRDLPVLSKYRKEGLITYRRWFGTLFKRPYIADLYWNEPSIMYHIFIKKLLRNLRF